MAYVKAIFKSNLAISDDDYYRLKKSSLGKEYTIYQVGRVVCSPTGRALGSASIKKAFGTFRYGNILVEVENVDADGNVLTEDKLNHSTLNGRSSDYQRVTRVFDLRSPNGVNDFFQYASSQGVVFTGDDFPGHFCEELVGKEMFDYIATLTKSGSMVNNKTSD